MIQLLVAIVVCLALQPAAPAARAHEATIAVAGGDHATPTVRDAQLHDAVPVVSFALVPPSLLSAPATAPRSFHAVARLWLRAQRLLC